MRQLPLLLLLLLALALCGATRVRGDDWALLVSGSEGYSNYRHQSDAAHAWQLIHGNGIPAKRIITMMVDDVANSSYNPFRGKLFNAPTPVGTPGRDVYAKLKPDYTGKMVSGSTFLSVLSGNSSALPLHSKVIRSGPNDRIFIFWVDHGAPGAICFPEGEMLYASDMIPVLKRMYEERKFKKMVFYLACESGSMFEGLLHPGWHIYASTASNARESSWGTYCPPHDEVDGVHLNTCLGDLYSVNWMQDAEENENGMDETLDEQFQTVVRRTDRSQVSKYGAWDFMEDSTGDYMGGSNKKKGSNRARATLQPARKAQPPAEKPAGHVSSRDIPMHLAYYRYLRAPLLSSDSSAALGALRAELDSREAALRRFTQLADLLARDALRRHGRAPRRGKFTTAEEYFAPPPTPVWSGPCVKEAVRALREAGCGYDDFSLQFHKVLVNACGQHQADELAGGRFIATQIRKVCTAGKVATA